MNHEHTLVADVLAELARFSTLQSNLPQRDSQYWEEEVESASCLLQRASYEIPLVPVQQPTMGFSNESCDQSKLKHSVRMSLPRIMGTGEEF